jgi:hypothetical protein
LTRSKDRVTGFPGSSWFCWIVVLAGLEDAETNHALHCDISEIIFQEKGRWFPMSIFAFQQYKNDLADIEAPPNKLARQQPQVTEVS